MVEFVEYTSDLVDELSTDELIDLLYSYDRYIRTFFEEHDEGSEPVCMVEYFNNDYQLVKDEEVED